MRAKPVRLLECGTSFRQTLWRRTTDRWVRTLRAALFLANWADDGRRRL